ncbi:divalent-cation tolerance protein CutA [Thiohalorhabdus methylotrophus]|uniref:Divalent-cation tolerance protein CutA n=1 Tax=Thiohalorhabdus methylotrophus TaxID=3242694 RepID=A0ABV4TRY9_9GAMM
MNIVVYTTCPDEDVARRISHKVVSEQLAACVHSHPAGTSVFEWEGKVEEESEILLMIKTKEKLYEALEAAILEQHPYDVPEIIAVSIDNGLASYLRWIDHLD